MSGRLDCGGKATALDRGSANGERQLPLPQSRSMRWPAFAMLLVAATASAQVNVSRIVDDAIVLDRVAQVSKRDLPADLLKRMVNEDIETLRGPRADGTYENASWERLEGGRKSDEFSVQPHGDKSQTIEMRGAFVYRVIIDSPARRLLVAKNRPVQIERVDIEYIPAGSTVPKIHSVTVGALAPGQNRAIDLPDIARQATARVVAKAEEGGYGNITISLVQARIVDRSDSPFADAVASEKAVLRALDNADIPSLRAMAGRIRDSLGGQVPVPATRTVEVTAPRVEVPPTSDIYPDLQAIEDLLTGNERERREGLDKLHQLLRRVRPH